MEPTNNLTPNNRGIEELKKKLYERDGGDFQVRRSNLNPYYKSVNKTWAEQPKILGNKSTGNAWLKIVGFSFLFFLLALTAAWYVFSQGKNVVSDKNIEISVKGPVSLKAGDELDLQIALTNKNTVAINEVELTTVWPEGSRDVDNAAKQFTYTTQKIGIIKSGETVNVITRAIVYGKENDELEIKLNLGYHLADSNTLFEKEVIYRFKINAAPVDLSVVIPSEINSNQELNISLKISANSDKPLSNILVEVIYPPGFQFKSASVPPTYDSRKWLVGDLLPGTERIINIIGVLEGQTEELKAFEVRTGVSDSAQGQNIAVLYNDFFKALTIKKPFLGISFLDVGRSVDAPLTLKSAVVGGYSIEWVNNLPVKLKDIKVTVRLTGEALDKRSVEAQDGYYSSIDNTITWDKSTKAEFESVEPGAVGRLNFSFGSLSLLGEGKKIRQPEIYADVTITGFRVSEGFANEKVQTDLARTVKIDSVVSFKTKTFYREGSLVNTGPIPPKVDTKTTYTLNWSLLNSSNDVKNGIMETFLPLGVEWMGMTSPTNETITYDTQSRKVVWDLGYIKAGTGVNLEPRIGSFQVALTPSVNQVSKPGLLTSGVLFRGVDIFTGSSLLIEADKMTTILSDSTQGDWDGFIAN